MLDFAREITEQEKSPESAPHVGMKLSNVSINRPIIGK